ncbi:MAG: hypothetical protein ABI035_05150 [Gemmatimonadaceae bacterium]
MSATTESMTRSTRSHRVLAALACVAGIILTTALQPTKVSAQTPATPTGAPTGAVRGVVTATTAAGDTVGASDVMVSLWTTDATTEALRDSACATWLADKTTWLQARQELASPSGINWTGTTMAHDLNILTELMAVRRDTTRTNASGEFAFEGVPIGAYTVEGEAFASNRFLQWNRDIAAIPYLVTMVRLDPGTLAENQYCSTSASAKGSVNPGDPADNGSRPPDVRHRTQLH